MLTLLVVKLGLGLAVVDQVTFSVHSDLRCNLLHLHCTIKIIIIKMLLSQNDAPPYRLSFM
jgi:hypothetical protein